MQAEMSADGRSTGEVCYDCQAPGVPKASDMENNVALGLTLLVPGTQGLIAGRLGATGMMATGELVATHGMTMSRRQFSALVESIGTEGIKDTIKYVVHNGRNYIVDGHHRVRAALQLGIKQVPVEKVTLPFRGYQSSRDLVWTRRGM